MELILNNAVGLCAGEGARWGHLGVQEISAARDADARQEKILLRLLVIQREVFLTCSHEAPSPKGLSAA
eukprot:8895965-Pyramimonas_sp.AAC.1